MRVQSGERQNHTAQVSGWLLAEQAFPELYRQIDADFSRFVGGTVIKGLTEVDMASTEIEPNDSTLLSSLQQAALGDSVARENTEVDVRTDVDERLFKAGHQTRVTLRVAAEGLEQGDRKMTDLYRNTLHYSTLNGEMTRRTLHEARSGFVIEELYRREIFKLYDAVLFSPSSTTMSVKEKKDYNFFVDTESCSIQYFQGNEDVITLESAFVAGKVTPDSERHDIKAIHGLVAEKGLQAPTTDGTDTIQHMYLIPKGTVRGVEDIVAWFDEAAGGTFYGQRQPRQDYYQYAKACYKKSEEYSSIVSLINDQLIREAYTFKTPMEAVLRLDALSAMHCVRRAVHDTDIKLSVFGKRSALEIEEARFFAAQGDQRRAEQSVQKAIEHDTSGSCPLFKKRDETAEGPEVETGEEGSNSNDEDKSNWTWKSGVCRVDKCPSRPSRTEVGPCDVCRGCQHLFDAGKNPFEVYGSAAAQSQSASSRAAPAKQAPVKTLFALAS